MSPIGQVSFHVQGDIGGVGVSRFTFVTQSSGAIVATDANAVAAAARALFNTMATNIPSGVSWTADPTCHVYDHITGLVQQPVVMTVIPAAVNGSGGNNWAAGVGARINWKTATLSGRRLIKGATFLAPLASTSFGSSGSVTAGTVTALNTAVATYLAALTTANLNPAVWHRPKKGTQAGGLAGIVFGGVASSTPASLRSRRR